MGLEHSQVSSRGVISLRVMQRRSVLRARCLSVARHLFEETKFGVQFGVRSRLARLRQLQQRKRAFPAGPVAALGHLRVGETQLPIRWMQACSAVADRR